MIYNPFCFVMRFMSAESRAGRALLKRAGVKTDKRFSSHQLFAEH